MSLQKHILIEKGILASFTMRQKFSDKEFLKIYKDIEANSKTDKEIQRKFHLIMEKRTQEQIPGSIKPNKIELRVEELFQRSLLLANFVKKDKNITKPEIILLLNCLARHLDVQSSEN
jgi:hypothetical protein